MKKLFFISFLLLVFDFSDAVNAQSDVITDVCTAIKEGNVEKVAKFFNTNIELTTDKGEEFYSQTQATAVLRDFFVRYPAKTFTVVHKGHKDDSDYVIGTYTSTKNINFRVYFFVKQNNSEKVIQNLRFEKE